MPISILRELTKAFENEILPWCRAGSLIPLLSRLPLQLPGSIGVRAYKTTNPATPEYHAYALNPTRWPEIGLHACRYPTLGCILEGEADILVGVTEKVAHQPSDADYVSSVHVLSLSQKNFFMFPAGVPYSDSSRPHWEREPVEVVDSRILWMRVLPMGVVLQMCTTRNCSHSDSAAVLVQSSQLSPLTQVLMECAGDLPNNMEIVDSCLLTLLLCINGNWPLSRTLDNSGERSVKQGVVLPVSVEKEYGNQTPLTLERACRYIQSNLLQPLSLPEIARNSYVSVSQLKRIFRSELDSSVMGYISRCRIEQAKSLLVETDILVNEIAELCGYRHRTHFTRLFTRQVGVSPHTFRRRQRSHDS